MPLPLLSLAPSLTPRPWGGECLLALLGKEIPLGETSIGESWELSDHPDGPSTISGGPFDGRFFGDLVRERPMEMIGCPQAPEKFPLLVKYIDASEDLSIQVHPDDEYTQNNNLPDRGKTECWYIMDCGRKTEIIYGVLPGTTRAILEDAIAQGSVPEVVNRYPLHPGDFLFVPPGTIHAILGGTLLCEIQQSSNITYRLWDWNRKPERELHIKESLDVTQYNNETLPKPYCLPKPSPEQVALIPLTTNDFFEVNAALLDAGNSMVLEQPGHGFILNTVSGEGTVDGEEIKTGSTFYVPACIEKVVLKAETPLTVLVTKSNELG